VVVLAGTESDTGDRSAVALARSLGDLGVQTTYLGRTESVPRITSAVADEAADAVEICLAGSGGVLLLRGLLRELVRIGRRDVSIVVHRVV
jgi:methylmalonyl-CoA mutase cobalamin-binding domain/chain